MKHSVLLDTSFFIRLLNDSETNPRFGIMRKFDPRDKNQDGDTVDRAFSIKPMGTFLSYRGSFIFLVETSEPV